MGKNIKQTHDNQLKVWPKNKVRIELLMFYEPS